MNPGDFHKYAKARWQKFVGNNKERLSEILNKMITGSRGIGNKKTTRRFILSDLGVKDSLTGYKAGKLPYPEIGSRHLSDARKAIQRSERVTEIPLKTRLDSFKEWKKTGKLPPIDWQTGEIAKGEALDKIKGMFPGGIPYRRSNDLVPIYRGAPEQSAMSILKDPKSRISQVNAVIPGQTGVHHTGSFFFPEHQHDLAKELQQYAKSSTGGGGPGAVLKALVPEKYVMPTGKALYPLGHSSEVVLPAAFKGKLQNVRAGGIELLPKELQKGTR